MHAIVNIANQALGDVLCNYTALDLGANHGTYTLPMANVFKKVYAFEPDPKNFQIMYDATKHLENVVQLQKAVSDKPGTIKLYWNPGNAGGHTISDRAVVEAGQGHSFESYVEVEAVTLDDFCRDLDIRFIKCDVEAAEGFIFNGAVEFLTVQSPVISMETHRELDHGALSKFFQNLGYTIYDGNGPIDSMGPDSVYLIRKPAS